MDRFSKIFIPLVFAGVIILFVLAIIPVKISRANSARVKAVVAGVSQGGLKDIVISLDGLRGIYYIRHSDENNFSVTDLGEKLANKEVIILYTKPRALSLLSPMTNTVRINELKLGNEVVFSEFQ